MRVSDEREEERFKRLDEVIRAYQRENQGRAEAAAAAPGRFPFFRSRVKKKKFGLFVLSLAAAVAINFYTGYMLCLFSAIYLLAEVALDSEHFVFK